MRTINAGVVGCADIAQRLVLPALVSMQEFNLVAVASRTLKKAEQFAQQFQCEAIEGYENLLARSDIEAVYIPLPIGLHHTWTLNALERNKHVLVEKSLAHNLRCAEEMILSAKKRKLALLENFMFVYHSQHEFVRKLIRSGEIGEIRVFRSSFGFPPPARDSFRYKTELGGGALLEAGAYPVKASQLFLGNRLSVQASSLVLSDEDGVDIFGGAFLVNDEGLFSEIAFGFDNYYQCNYEIWGSKGKLIAERAFTAGPGYQPKIVVERQDERHEYILPADNHFVNILREFHGLVSGGQSDALYDEMYAQAHLIDQVLSCASR